MSDTALLVPDPRLAPVPAGWWDSHVRPTIAACESWTQLNEYEGQLQAMANLVESFGGESLEFQKALRVVEARRGALLGEPAQGRKPLLPRVEEVPHATANRYRTLSQHWDRTLYPYLLQETDPAKVSQSRLLQVVYRKANEQKLELLTARKTAPQFDRLYDVIVIDPPWPMEKQERTKRPTQSKFDYPTMTEDELTEFPLPARANCHVWLWTTQRFLPVAFRLITAWMFNYVCTFVWHKPGGFQAIGLPQYNCEFVLYARRGTPRFTTTKALPTCFNAPRGKHSEKPEAFYRFVRRVTQGHRIDIFNRRAIEGFRGWGNEAEVMGIYATDRPFSDAYLPELRRLIGPHLLVPSSLEQDCHEAADLVVLKARDLTIACRVRRSHYLTQYAGQFTIRCRRDSGAKTELAKIAEGWGDWFFYGFAVERTHTISPWWLIDLSAFRAQFIREGMRQKKLIKWGERSNGDGTHFCWFQIDSFPRNPPLLIASGVDDAPDEPITADDIPWGLR